jgi:hypothetical protein
MGPTERRGASNCASELCLRVELLYLFQVALVVRLFARATVPDHVFGRDPRCNDGDLERVRARVAHRGCIGLCNYGDRIDCKKRKR